MVDALLACLAGLDIAVLVEQGKRVPMLQYPDALIGEARVRQDVVGILSWLSFRAPGFLYHALRPSNLLASWQTPTRESGSGFHGSTARKPGRSSVPCARNRSVPQTLDDKPGDPGTRFCGRLQPLRRPFLRQTPSFHSPGFQAPNRCAMR